MDRFYATKAYIEKDIEAHHCDTQIPLISTVGRGPKGDGIRVDKDEESNSYKLYNDHTNEFLCEIPYLGLESFSFKGATENPDGSLKLTMELNGTEASIDIPRGPQGRPGADGKTVIPQFDAKFTNDATNVSSVELVNNGGTEENPAYMFEFKNVAPQRTWYVEANRVMPVASTLRELFPYDSNGNNLPPAMDTLQFNRLTLGIYDDPTNPAVMPRDPSDPNVMNGINIGDTIAVTVSRASSKDDTKRPGFRGYYVRTIYTIVSDITYMRINDSGKEIIVPLTVFAKIGGYSDICTGYQPTNEFLAKYPMN